jgi:hypothetical protein
MSADDRLLYEARVRMRWAVVTGAAGVLILIAAALALTGAHTSVNEETLGLVYVHKRFPLDVIAAVVNGFGLVAFAAAITFLAGAARARRPELTATSTIAAWVGGGLAALSGIVLAVVLAVKSQTFVTHTAETYTEAHKIWTTPLVLGAQYAGLLGALGMAVAIVMTSLSAMRVGLLTRFMGYLGIFVAVLQMGFIPTPVPVVQAFWLFAVAYLLSGRWPSGVPPAWRSGKAEAWPSSAELREQRIKAGAARGRATPSPQPAPQTVGASASSSRGTRSTTPKRKRKRRK